MNHKLNLKKQLACIYTNNFFSGLRITDAVWVALLAARAFARDCAAGERRSDALTEEMFSQYLYSNGLPDPELLIRPGGEKRISNYLLWQCAYSEFYFCDTLWPDFDEREFDKALIAYQHRERRFGGVKP